MQITVCTSGLPAGLIYALDASTGDPMWDYDDLS